MERAGQAVRAEAPRSAALALGLAVALALTPALARPAAAEPVDLGDARPRWIALDFPSLAEGAATGAPRPTVLGWLEPGPERGLVTVRVPGASVETVLLAEAEPVPGSFGDFVWIFERASGHVLRAETRGRVVERVGWSVVSLPVEVDLRIRLDTRRAIGLSAPREWNGRPVREVCHTRADCTPVEPVPYRPATGAVRAVGGACANWRGAQRHAFTPFGDVRLRELPGEAQHAPPATATDDGVRTGWSWDATSPDRDSCG